jgi:hypothetical protein
VLLPSDLHQENLRLPPESLLAIIHRRGFASDGLLLRLQDEIFSYQNITILIFTLFRMNKEYKVGSAQSHWLLTFTEHAGLDKSWIQATQT